MGRGQAGPNQLQIDTTFTKYQINLCTKYMYNCTINNRYKFSKLTHVVCIVHVSSYCPIIKISCRTPSSIFCPSESGCLDVVARSSPSPSTRPPRCSVTTSAWPPYTPTLTTTRSAASCNQVSSLCRGNFHKYLDLEKCRLLDESASSNILCSAIS